MRTATFASIGVAACALIGLTGCTPPEGTVPSTVLSIGTDDHPGVPAADQIEEFVRQVDRLSDGAITIEPVWRAAGETADWDQAVARMVITGELDMGLIPTRAWDTEGVSSLRPLNTPFLIDSDELLREVIAGDLAESLLSGLPDVGVVGIGILPEGLRHPFGFNGPLLSPGDYRGQTVRAATSAVAKEMFAALGANVTDDEPNATNHVGSESSFLLNPGGVATGNVTFYPKALAMVVNAAAYDDLDDGQRAVLDDATSATLAWTTKHQLDELSAARAFCDAGGTVVHASATDILELQTATASVATEIATEPGNASVVAAIEKLRKSLPAPPVAPECAPEQTAAAAEIASLNGTYRVEVTRDDYLDAGVTDPATIAENDGVWTWSFQDGVWMLHQVKSNGGIDDDRGTYVVDGDRVRMTFPSISATETYGWQIDQNGDLRLTAIETIDDVAPVFMGAHPFVRISP